MSPVTANPECRRSGEPVDRKWLRLAGDGTLEYSRGQRKNNSGRFHQPVISLNRALKCRPNGILLLGLVQKHGQLEQVGQPALVVQDVPKNVQDLEDQGVFGRE